MRHRIDTDFFGKRSQYSLKIGSSAYWSPNGLMFFDGRDHELFPLSRSLVRALPEALHMSAIDPLAEARMRFHLQRLTDSGWILPAQCRLQTPQVGSRRSNDELQLANTVLNGTRIPKAQASFPCTLQFPGYAFPIIVGCFPCSEDISNFLHSIQENIEDGEPVLFHTTLELVEQNKIVLANARDGFDFLQPNHDVIFSISVDKDGNAVESTHPHVKRKNPAEARDYLPESSPGFGFFQNSSISGNGYGFNSDPVRNRYLDSLCHPIFGPVRVVREIALADLPDLDRLIHNCVADHAFPQPETAVSRKSSPSISGGKGQTARDARSSAIGEAIERVSGIGSHDKPDTIATYSELGPLAIHPNEICLFSETQYSQRTVINSANNPYERVPDAMHGDEKVSWKKVRDLSGARDKYILFCQGYYSADEATSKVFAVADSNGCASAWTYTESILQATLELIERDAVAIWWYNRFRANRVEWPLSCDRYTVDLGTTLSSIGRDFWLLDITSDLGVPCIAALSSRSGREIAIGFGCHLSLEIATRRAAMEMAQFLPLVVSGNYRRTPNAEVRTWFASRELSDDDFLRGREGQSSVAHDSYEHGAKRALDDVLGKLRDKGHSCFFLDQSLPGCELKVVRVVAPGLRHFWRRLGPGRLYQAPVWMGVRERPLLEYELNPETVFF